MKHRSAWIILLLAIIAMATPRAASAQGGVLVGLNSANIDFDAGDFGVTINGDRRVGFVGGLAFNMPIQDVFSVELDVLYAQKGAKYTLFGDTFKAKLDYVDVPVLGRINLAGSGPVRLHLLIGPSFNFKVSEKFEPSEANAEDEVERFETALVFGGGVTLRPFRIDLRYGLGLTNIVKDSAGADPGLTGKNKVFSVMVGFGG